MPQAALVLQMPYATVEVAAFFGPLLVLASRLPSPVSTQLTIA